MYSNSLQTTHAEICALHNLNIKKRKISKLILVSAAFDGKCFYQSKPCTNCCKSLISYGIQKLYWYDGENWILSKTDVLLEESKYSSGDRPC